MKPCIIIRVPSALFGQSYSAWNEDGRMIVQALEWNAVNKRVLALGYTPVPVNSRLGATILDKVVCYDH